MLSARAPGQTPRMPTSFFGAAATAAVAVPCRLSSGRPPSVLVLESPNSGWVSSRRVSSSAISGLSGVTAADRGSGPRRPRARRPGGLESGSSATGLGAPQRVGLGVDAAGPGCAARVAIARARPRADHVVAAADPPRAERAAPRCGRRRPGRAPTSHVPGDRRGSPRPTRRPGNCIGSGTLRKSAAAAGAAASSAAAAASGAMRRWGGTRVSEHPSRPRGAAHRLLAARSSSGAGR